MIQRIGLAILSAAFITGCYGRIQNEGGGRKIDPNAFGIDASKPALLVFGAVWCKPCMSEIKSLNRANRELGGRLQIASFVVEGPQKGVAASPKDTELVVSPGGDKPEYKMTTDPTWNRFELIGPEGGRALPTMVFIDGSMSVVRIVQRSMEYESELLPALQALVRGQNPVGPKPGELGEGVRSTLSMTDWTAQAGHDPASAVYANVRAGWERGLADFNFLEDDMPFDAATMTILTFQDGTTRPVQAVWKASMTGCKLTVFFLADGSYERSEGICR